MQRPPSAPPLREQTAPIEVVLCAYNGERYIGEQIDSILRQTLLPRRLSIHDDLSTDGTRELVAQIAREYQGPVDIVLQSNARNLGYVKNFEHGIRSATLDFIALSDQDDVWGEEKLATLLAAFRDETLVVFSDALLVDQAGRSLGATLREAIGLTDARLAQFADRQAARHLLLQQSYVTGAALMMRRKLVASLPPFPAAAPHDYWLAIVAAELGKIQPIPQRLYRYRQHGGNVLGQERRGFWSTAWNAFRRADRRYESELATYRSIASALDHAPALAHLRDPYRAKASFLEARQCAVAARARGVPRLARLLANGDYRRFCRTGAAMFAKDLCVLAARAFRRTQAA